MHTTSNNLLYHDSEHKHANSVRSILPKYVFFQHVPLLVCLVTVHSLVCTMAAMIACTRRQLAGVRSLHDVHAEEEERIHPLPQSIAHFVVNAGCVVCRKWRPRFGIVYKTPGMKLKVTWEKILLRMTVLWNNVCRLRRLSESRHPCVDMRFISIDQKPIWCYNAGHKGSFDKKVELQPGLKENLAPTRQRYTVSTSVHSWRDEDTANAPLMVVHL